MLRFDDTPEGNATYLDILQRGEGFIANCCSGYPEGYMFHRASCKFLNAHKTRNPIRGTTNKIWAAKLAELEANAPRGAAPARCSCLQPTARQEYDSDIERESHLVVPGGQVESNRSRH